MSQEICNCLSDFGASDYINLALLIATIVGLAIGLSQFRKSVRSERARLLRDLVRDIQNDDQAYSIFYKIEYGEFSYDGFHGSEDERALDKLLMSLDLVCELYFRHHLTRSEMEFFDYYICRVYNDDEVGRYLKFLEGWYRDIGVSPGGFDALSKYASRLGAKDEATT